VSIAGQRAGLAGARTGLFWEFIRLIQELQPKVVCLENVPGLLSSNRGRDFHTVLQALADCGLVGAWRFLDSQYFGLAQRRKRVFIVGCARTSGLDPAEILFESIGRAGDLAPRRSTGPRVAASLRGRSSRAGVNEPGRGGEDDQNLICFDWQSGGDVRHNVSSSSSSSSSLQTNQTPAVLVGAQSAQGVGTCGADDNQAQARHLVEVFPISGDAAAGRSGDAETLSPDAEGTMRLRPPSLGIGLAGQPSFTVSAGSVPAIAATLNAGGHEGGFRTEPGEHLVLSDPRERERALTGTMFKRHDEDTDTLIPVANTLQSNSGRRKIEETMIPIASPVTASAGHHGHSSPRGDGQDNLVAQPMVFESRVARNGRGAPDTVAPPLKAENGQTGKGDGAPCVMGAGVRRLTPLECERLQGFPDGWSCLCSQGHRGSIYCTCPDTPRYKQMGNAVSVPVAQWIAQRIPLRIAKVGIA
jgi:DNA (cytosine-5)-methyltransferase 1